MSDLERQIHRLKAQRRHEEYRVERARTQTWPQPSYSIAGPSTCIQSRSVEEQLALIDRQLEDRSEGIQRAKEHMRAASAELRALETERSKLLQDRQTLTAPIMKLPYELLARIFELGNEEEDEREWVESVPDDDEDEEEAHFATLVSHVNRRFRDVALTTASLWTHICVSDEHPYPLTTLWLERAKLIDVDLDYTEEYWLDGQRMREIIGTIKPPSRWRTFSLRTDNYFPIHVALSCMDEPAPNLRCLELINARRVYDEDEVEMPTLADPVDIFGGDAPLLRSVSLYAVPLRWRAPMLSGLEVLELEYHTNEYKPRLGDWLHLIRASPALKKLVIMASGPYIPEELDDANYPAVEVVKLEELEHLELGDLRPHVLSHLIQMLHVPCLNYLALDTLESYDYVAPLRLISEKRYPALKTLKYVIVNLPEDEFIALLRRLPGVEQLELNETDVLLDVIMSDDKDPSRRTGLVLPKLHTLRTTGYDGNQLAAFVEQRKRLGGEVKTVLVSYTDEEQVHGAHLTYLKTETQFGYFEGSDREQDDSDDDEEEEEEEGSDWNMEDDEQEEDGFGGDEEDWVDDDEEVL